MLNNLQSQQGNRRPVVLKPGNGIAMLLMMAFVMLVILSVATNILFHDNISQKAIQITSVLQDILVFIIPAIAAAITVTRLPADFLSLTVKPHLKPTMMALLVLLTSLPAMEAVIVWNNNITFPDSLSGLESILRGLEDSAADKVAELAKTQTVFDLIISILIMGLLTGLAEELFFRGAMQNLFMSARMRPHVAIWLTAFIFSAMHMQFYGLIPRLLLGAYFGYLIWWTGSLWVPVIVHAFNNSMIVFVGWLSDTSASGQTDVESALYSEPSVVILSVVVTALGIIILRRLCLNRKQ